MTRKRPTFGDMNSNKEPNVQYLNSSSKTDSSMSTVLIGGGVIVIVSSITFIGTILMAGASTSQKSAYFANEAKPVARAYDRALLQSTAAFGGIARTEVKMKVNRTEIGFDAIDSELHERCLKPDYPRVANDVMRLGNIILKPRSAAAYVECSMGVVKSRLCESYYSKRLASRLAKTIKQQAHNKARIERLMKSGGQTGLMVNMAKRVKDADRDQQSEGIRSGNNKGPIISASLGQKITELSKHGLLSKSDFGGLFATVPPEIQPYIVEQTVKVCPFSLF